MREGCSPTSAAWRDGIPCRKPVAGASDHDVVAEAPCLKLAGQEPKVAFNLEARRQGVLEDVFEILLVESWIGEVSRLASIGAGVREHIDRRVDIAIGNLVQHGERKLPIRTKILLHPNFADLIIHIHA